MIGIFKVLVLRGVKNLRLEVSPKSVELKLLDASNSLQTLFGKTECK